MTIRNFLLQLSLIFALIIGLTACEKDPVIDPMDNVEEVTNETQLKSQADCEELLAELLEMYSEEELAELGIDPETFCDEIEWEGDDDEWDDIDWEMGCDSIVAMYVEELEALGFDPETFCEDFFDGVVVIEIDFDDFTAENCDSIIAIYADQLEEWGIDPETFCDEWDDDWGNDDEWDDIDWAMDCDSIVAIYADQLEEWGIDPDTFCDEWGDWDYGDTVCCIVTTNCGVLAYAEEVEVVAENGQITVYNEAGEVLDSIECEDDSVEVECHGG